MAAKKTRKKKTTTRKKSAPTSRVVTHEPEKGKDAAAAKGKDFMAETRDDDRADAITKGIKKAVTSAKETVKELRTNLDLIEQTVETKDVHLLLEMARRTSGEVVLVLQEEITKAKKKTKEAGFKW
jgi:archaellum component FlaC